MVRAGRRRSFPSRGQGDRRHELRRDGRKVLRLRRGRPSRPASGVQEPLELLSLGVCEAAGPVGLPNG